ncbi:serine/threonine-protein kinase PLK1-like [Ornithodoros turicata]|uniref:serine/threonine-protein kinase PLK1-like n=1 Tax=Ornithodoros turicata TaxID=34597 RepID=UPI003139AABE
MATSSDKVNQKDVPDIVIDQRSKKEYIKGRFLGKGGFAKCYELTDRATKVVYAGKVVSKSLLVKSHQKEKMTQEITIHKSLRHKHIVGFHSFFEDDKNVYIVLELCNRHSLMEMQRRRKSVTEPEARYFMQQLLLGCRYLVQEKVIHRDLKLGNLFLNDKMELKIGDFGLATRLDFEGERKKTLCGTPNYIAPEVLGKKGHSFEVDIWSIGCILYTLLVGRPPFETSSLKETYIRIKKNEYRIPSSVGPTARTLIQKMLQLEPERRPNVEAVLADDFFTSGPIPQRLPVSCLTTAPRFDTMNASLNTTRKPLVELKENGGNELTPIRTATGQEVKGMDNAKEQKPPPKPEIVDERDSHLKELQRLLRGLLESSPRERAFQQDDDAEDPAATPVFWVSKWVDYTDKYGLGYQLCDNSIAVLFNDSTRIVLLNNNVGVTYVDREGQETYHSLDQYPSTLEKKVTLLKYFRNYMNQHLLKAGESVAPREGDDLVRLPYLRSWFRTRSAIVLHLTNGTVQINFFQDHTKIILCPLMAAVSYIDTNRAFRTFKLRTLETSGCSPDLATRLKYAKNMVERLIKADSNTAFA